MIDASDAARDRLLQSGPQSGCEDLWHAEIASLLNPRLHSTLRRLAIDLADHDSAGVLPIYLDFANRLHCSARFDDGGGQRLAPTPPASECSALRAENEARRFLADERPDLAEQYLLAAFDRGSDRARIRVLHIVWGFGNFDFFDRAAEWFGRGDHPRDLQSFATLARFVRSSQWVRTNTRAEIWRSLSTASDNRRSVLVEEVLREFELLRSAVPGEASTWEQWERRIREIDREQDFTRYRATVLRASEEAEECLDKARFFCVRSFLPTLAQNHGYWTQRYAELYDADDIQSARVQAVVRVNTIECRAICTSVFDDHDRFARADQRTRHRLTAKVLSSCGFDARVERARLLLDTRASLLAPDTLLAAAGMLRGSLRGLPDPSSEDAPGRTAMVISGQARGFLEAFPTQLENAAVPNSCDVIVTTWDDVGVPRGAHANRLSRMIPDRFAVPGTISDSEFERAFPNAYLTLTPPEIDVAEQYQRMFGCRSDSRIELHAVDVETDQSFVENELRRGTWPDDRQLQNQVRMLYKMHRANELLTAVEQKVGQYERVVWSRPDCPVLRLTLPDRQALAAWAFSSFVMGTGFGDYLMVLSREAFRAIASIYASLSAPWPLWDRHAGVGPILFGDTLLWNGFGLEALGPFGQVGELLGWKAPSQEFADAFSSDYQALRSDHYLRQALKATADVAATIREQ